MQKPIASLMAVGLLLLAACSTAEVEPGPITSFDDIAGTTYERQGPGGVGYFHFFEDGTWHGSTNQDLVEDSPFEIYETRWTTQQCRNCGTRSAYRQWPKELVHRDRQHKTFRYRCPECNESFLKTENVGDGGFYGGAERPPS